MTVACKNILENIRYATISSVDPEGRPWGAPVWYVFGKKFKYYSFMI